MWRSAQVTRKAETRTRLHSNRKRANRHVAPFNCSSVIPARKSGGPISNRFETHVSDNLSETAVKIVNCPLLPKFPPGEIPEQFASDPRPNRFSAASYVYRSLSVARLTWLRPSIPRLPQRAKWTDECERDSSF